MMPRRTAPAMHRTAASLLALALTLHAVRAVVLMDDVVRVFQRAKDEVVQNWRYNPNIICATSTMCGYIEKRASGSELSKLFMRTTSTDDEWPEIAAGVPLFSGIQVYISNKFKFIYIRTPKASSSSILTTLQQMYCANPAACQEDEFARMKVARIDDGVWMSYFVFTAIRNPINRMLSTYNMFIEHLRFRAPGSSVPGPPCNVPFLAYSQRVLLLRSTCETDGCCAFVAGDKNEFVDKLVNAHITQQAHSILTPDGASVVDYIICTESASTAWAAVSQEISRRSGIDVPYQPLLHANAKAAHGAGRRRAGRRLATCRKAVAPPPAAGSRLTAPRGAALAQVPEGGTWAGPGPLPVPGCVDPVMLPLLNETTMFGLAQQFALDLIALRYNQLPQPDMRR